MIASIWVFHLVLFMDSFTLIPLLFLYRSFLMCLCILNQGSPYRTWYRAVRVPVTYRTGTYRLVRAVHFGMTDFPCIKLILSTKISFIKFCCTWALALFNFKLFFLSFKLLHCQLGAISVNLIAGEKPADVYSEIAARVLGIMRRDADKDPTVNRDALRARLLVDQVDRKLVKQTVMTSVYGVTYVGAREQINRRLKERGLIADDTELFGASCYAAKTTLTALGEMFQAARSIMNWLGDCAKVIASENHPVRWTTPIGLPVVQPYRKLENHLASFWQSQYVRTSLQVLTLKWETEKFFRSLSGDREQLFFPPNFVHSLDGSHMMMTAVACKRAGLNFAGVHDSYWTHACDVDQMNRILCEKFVELYERPILEELLESCQQSFPTLNFPPLPERGDFDLQDVLESPYSFN
ncbi:unnamed protein product [Musa hybrid cultivar]